MIDTSSTATSITPIEGRNIVSLKVSAAVANTVAKNLSLCPPLQMDCRDPGSLWVAPGCWLLFSNTQDAESLIEDCNRKLRDQLHLVVDMSDGLSLLAVEGQGARDLVASACSLDLRPNKFSIGSCQRTRFAQVPVFVAKVGEYRFELTVDRSYSQYLHDWLTDSSGIAERILRNE